MQHGEGMCFLTPEPRLGKKRQVTIHLGLGRDSSVSGGSTPAGTLTSLKWGSVPPKGTPDQVEASRTLSPAASHMVTVASFPRVFGGTWVSRGGSGVT